MSYSTDYSAAYRRCTIIRGKSQNDMDDLLPLYADIVADICPLSAEEFTESFNARFAKAFYNKEDSALDAAERKTLANHRTEISGKLFGLYATDERGNVYATETCLKLLEDADQPAFFKNICLGLQFPNGAKKSDGILEDIREGYRIRPLCYVVKLLDEAENAGVSVTKEDIAFYVLSHIDVLSGRADTSEVIAAMASDKARKINRKLCISGKASSYTHQHINEQLNLLVLANILVISSDKTLHLNRKEDRIIEECIRLCSEPLGFDCDGTPHNTAEERMELIRKWTEYYGKFHAPTKLLATEHGALAEPEQHPDTEETSTEILSDTPDNPPAKRTSTIELGDVGEKYVYDMERSRVARTRPDLVNKILLLGKTKGFGYDVLSVEAGDDFDTAELARHIEVKTTKRATAPDPNSSALTNYVHLTRKEWVAAQQHREQYYIYLVFYSVGKTTVCAIRNPAAKVDSKEMQLIALDYRLHYPGRSLTHIND